MRLAPAAYPAERRPALDHSPNALARGMVRPSGDFRSVGGMRPLGLRGHDGETCRGSTVLTALTLRRAPSRPKQQE